MQKWIAERAEMPPSSLQQWLDLASSVQVEMTSEDAAWPIESALLEGEAGDGWRAAQPGEQVIRLLFDQPQRLTRILLLFVERELERTQEFVLRWSDDGDVYHEIVRQQWNFSPSGTTEEFQDFRVDLSGVRFLELAIEPDISGGNARASLTRLCLA